MLQISKDFVPIKMIHSFRFRLPKDTIFIYLPTELEHYDVTFFLLSCNIVRSILLLVVVN